MAYVVTEQCIKCKYTDCVEVCPVDCFREGAEMLVIDPDICIDCAVCEPACPVDAIKPDTHPDGIRWRELNERLARVWQTVTVKREPFPDAKSFASELGKFEKYLKNSLEP
jgi:ferredoxin